MKRGPSLIAAIAAIASIAVVLVATQLLPSRVPAPSPSPSAASATPSGPFTDARAKETIANDCRSCHAGVMLEQQRLTEKQWKATLEKMQKWGSPLEPVDVEPFAKWLAVRYSVDAPPFVGEIVDAAFVPAALEPLPDGKFAGGNAARGAKLYAEQCAQCHGANARGERLGVNLVNRPSIWRAPDVERLIRNGSGRMPVTDTATLPDSGIADLLAWLRSQKPSS